MKVFVVEVYDVEYNSTDPSVFDNIEAAWRCTGHAIVANMNDLWDEYTVDEFGVKEVVSLLKEEKYEDALEKFHSIQADIEIGIFERDIATECEKPNLSRLESLKV